MKYGFSTLVCPEWSWADVCTAASDLGFDGIELRGIGKEIYLPRSAGFSGAGLTRVRAELERLNLKIPCLATGAFLFDASLSEAVGKEVRDYIELAGTLDTPYIRVLADRDPMPGYVDENAVKDNMRSLLPIAKEAGVTLLIETNGVYADSAKLRGLCEELDHPALGVLWDIHHPYRYFKEAPDYTYKNLAPFIRHIHLKDSVMINGKAEYRMMGYGDVPYREAVDLLKTGGYEGFLVLEWVKRWNMGLEEPGIVLPHFLSAVKG